MDVSSTEKCILCYQSIDKYSASAWKQITGFVGGPKKDSMRLREDTGRYAHEECVKKLSAGQAIDQPSIFDNEDRASIDSWSPLPEEL